MADRVPPTIRLLLLCLDARYDEETGETILTNPIGVAGLPPGSAFPYTADHLSLYAQVSDGIGVIPLSVELRQVYDGDEEDRVVFQSDPYPLTCPLAPRLEIQDIFFPLGEVEFVAPGIYEFRLQSDVEGFESPVAMLRVLDREAGL